MHLVNARISLVTGAPVIHQEVTNILHYARAQEYSAHYDFYPPEVAAQKGQRVATMLVYLNDAYEGGETEFPKLNWRFKGKAGDALLFFSLSPEGLPESASLHAGLPVTKGDKWLLSKWIRDRPAPLI